MRLFSSALRGSIPPLLLVSLLAFVHASAQETWTVGRVSFTGNQALSSGDLLDVMELRPPGLLRSVPYAFSKLVTDIEALEALYRSKGFLDATVSITALERDSADNKISIRLTISEGPLTRIASVAFGRSAVLSDSALDALVALEPGDPLDSSAYTRAETQIRDRLAAMGRLFARVEHRIDVDSTRHAAGVTFTVHDGPVVLAGDPEIVGLDRVRDRVVMRELAFESGDTLVTAVLQRTLRRLYGTGLFTFVGIEPLDTITLPQAQESVVAPVLVQVREADMLAFLLSGGYDSFEGFYTGLELAYRNLFGLGHRVGVSVRASPLLLGARLSYMYPRVLSLPLSADLTGYVERRKLPSFEGLFEGGVASLNGVLGMSNSYRTWVRLEHVDRFRQAPPTPEFPSAPLRSTAAIGAGLRRDTRQSVFRRATSLVAGIEGELAGPGLSWSHQFYKTRADLRGYYAFLDNRVSVGAAVSGGYVDGYGHDRNVVPPQELWRIGIAGVRAVRGYEEEEVSPTDENGNERGGKLAVVINALEFEFPLYWVVRGAAFVDAGYVWPDLAEFDLGDLRWSAGPGLRADLFVLVARLDYGVQLRRGSGLDGRVHFGIGLPF